MPHSESAPSQLVRVAQVIKTRQGAWQTRVEGRVLSCSNEPTGSWYAHGPQGRLSLWRLRIQKQDGEIVDLVLDSDSAITALD
jgi:hypothetical protein